MFSISRGLGAWTAAVAVTVVLGALSTGPMIAVVTRGSPGEPTPPFTREFVILGAWAGGLIGLVGGLIGLLLTRLGFSLRRVAFLAPLSLLPAAMPFLLFPYTTWLALSLMPLCVVGGGLSGLTAARLTRLDNPSSRARV